MCRQRQIRSVAHLAGREGDGSPALQKQTVFERSKLVAASRHKTRLRRSQRKVHAEKVVAHKLAEEGLLRLIAYQQEQRAQAAMKSLMGFAGGTTGLIFMVSRFTDEPLRVKIELMQEIIAETIPCQMESTFCIKSLEPLALTTLIGACYETPSNNNAWYRDFEKRQTMRSLGRTSTARHHPPRKWM